MVVVVMGPLIHITAPLKQKLLRIYQSSMLIPRESIAVLCIHGGFRYRSPVSAGTSVLYMVPQLSMTEMPRQEEPGEEIADSPFGLIPIRFNLTAS
jgi:hypothetical protein